MATAYKKLGAADLSASTNTSIYVVPSSKMSIVNCTVTNRSASAVTFRIAVAESGTPGNEDYYQYDTSLAANQSFQRTGIMMDTTKVLVAYGSSGDISVVADGIEVDT